jgi:4-hydroxy-4-methyl-2-oxoglutarate aldolase
MAARPGLIINTFFERPDATLVGRFASASTGYIGDALGRSGALSGDIKPVVDVVHMCGTAVTVEAPPGDNLVVWKALSLAQPGDVLVVATDSHRSHSVWGDMAGRLAASKGLAGLVTDGAVRDVAGLREIGLPTFSAAITPNSPEKDGPGKVNVPIACGGRVVCPGDIIVGDVDGVVVVPRDIAESVAEELERISRYEEERSAAISAGGGVPDWVDKKLESLGYLPLPVPPMKGPLG